MNLLDTANPDNSIYHHSLFLLGKAATDTTSLPVQDFARSSTIYYRRAAYLMWRHSGGWDFDDANYTSLPIATTTLVDSQQDYSIPTNSLEIQRVEVLDSAGVWQLMEKISMDQVADIALSEYYKNGGMPRFYRIDGNSIFLYPFPLAANVTLSAGLKIYLSRDISSPYTSPLSNAYRSILTAPGFHIDFHPYLSYGVAVDYAMAKNYTKEKQDALAAAFKDWENSITDYYGRRDVSYENKMRPRVRSAV